MSALANSVRQVSSSHPIFAKFPFTHLQNKSSDILVNFRKWHRTCHHSNSCLHNVCMICLFKLTFKRNFTSLWYVEQPLSMMKRHCKVNTKGSIECYGTLARFSHSDLVCKNLSKTSLAPDISQKFEKGQLSPMVAYVLQLKAKRQGSLVA